jgi:hypothetical protein
MTRGEKPAAAMRRHVRDAGMSKFDRQPNIDRHGSGEAGFPIGILVPCDRGARRRHNGQRHGQVPKRRAGQWRRAQQGCLVLSQERCRARRDHRSPHRGWRRQQATSKRTAPGLAGAIAVARPIPLVAPVTKVANPPWDVVFGSDIFERFKPHPEKYLGTARLLDLEPGQAHSSPPEVVFACRLTGRLIEATPQPK